MTENDTSSFIRDFWHATYERAGSVLDAKLQSSESNPRHCSFLTKSQVVPLIITDFHVTTCDLTSLRRIVPANLGYSRKLFSLGVSDYRTFGDEQVERLLYSTHAPRGHGDDRPQLDRARLMTATFLARRWSDTFAECVRLVYHFLSDTRRKDGTMRLHTRVLTAKVFFPSPTVHSSPVADKHVTPL